MIDMEDELSADYEMDGDDNPVSSPIVMARMHFAVAFLFAAWYSLILGAAMTSV